MSTALVQGQAATWLEVTVPTRGPMLIRAKAPDDVTPVAGRVAFAIGDLTITVASLVADRSGMFAGSWSGMALTGAGGWRAPISARGYRSPAGLPNVQILADAASEVGELPPVVSTPRSVGGFYVRQGGEPASQVFCPTVIGPDDWWVDENGITRVGTRTPGPITAEFALLDVDRKSGCIHLASESPAAFMPGRTFTDPLEGSFTVNAAVWTADGGKLRGEIWTA